MAGLYLHIPFCKSRCIYCGFYSTTLLSRRQHYVDALCQEMLLRQCSSPIETVYLGGGTPSQLSPEQLRQLFLYISKVYRPCDGAEITMECNPDDVSESFARLIEELPVNRVSMGVQTFDDARLRFLRRRHTASQIAVAIERLRKAGIGNISIDLMYGFPEQSIEAWREDIRQALRLHVEHISAYSLMYEEGTPLYQQLQSGQVKEVDEELSRQMYYELKDLLADAGFEHYEISNFARPGFRSRHNSSYWNLTPYIGLGAAAHSYDGSRRQWNVADVGQYIAGMESGHPQTDYETLDDDTRYNEHIMLGLRTCEGADLDSLSPRQRDYCLEQSASFLGHGWLERRGHRLKLTRQGLFVSDMIIGSLFL